MPRHLPSPPPGGRKMLPVPSLPVSEPVKEEVLEESFLETLYHILLQLSIDEDQHQCQVGGFLQEEQCLTDIHDISDMLFEELHRQFGQFMSNRCLLSSTKLTPLSACEKHDLHSDMLPSSKYLVLLLRCCVIILHPLEFKDTKSAYEKCQVLRKLVKELCCLDDITQLPHQCTCRQSSPCACSFKKYYPIISLQCSLLEAFLDELLLRQNIINLFIDADTFFEINKKFAPHGRIVGMTVILELISAHFILSINNNDFGKFLLSVFSCHWLDHVIPQLSLTAIMPLLKTLVLCSIPHMLQVHLILLASRSIGIHASSTNRASDMMLLHNYIASFDQSINLYGCHVISLQPGVGLLQSSDQSEDCFISSQVSEHFLHISTDSCLELATYEKMNVHISKLVELGDNCFSNMSSKGNAANHAMVFVEENIHIIEESLRQEMLLFLNFILSLVNSCEDGINMVIKSDINWQDIYYIAALLKLMSFLLLKVVWVFKGLGTSDCIKNAKDQCLQREYKFLYMIIYSFIHSFGNQMVLNVTFRLPEANSAGYDGIHRMLMHFISLLLCSLQHGYVHLWKGCILMIISLLNLLSFEEGSLDSLKSLFSYSGNSFVSCVTPSIVTQGKSCQRSSLVIASNFKKTQALYLQNMTNLLTFGNKGKHAEGSIMKVERKLDILTVDQEDMELNMDDIGRQNSENYLSLTGCNRSEIDDLADFIDCKHMKDYSTLLMNRRKFRKWKCKKMVVARRREIIKRKWTLDKTVKKPYGEAV